MDQGKHTPNKGKWNQITEKERYKIEVLYEQGKKPAQIAEAMTPKRDRRTIEREIRLGLVEQKRMNPSNSKYAPMYITEMVYKACLLYTSDAADERSSVDLGGRRIIKKDSQVNPISRYTLFYI